MDFLTFKSFISTAVLIIIYYFGALVFPVCLWALLAWLTTRYKVLNLAYKNGKEMLWASLNTKQKIMFVALFMVCFLFMELFWRMMFEFLIAYMQIRDALLQTPL